MSEKKEPSGDPSPGPRKFELYGVQYLRAFAALGVLMFHAVKRSGGEFDIGAAGVDVFFVISGAIMQIISTRRPIPPAAFLADRIRRIVPPYWFVSLIVILGTAAGLFPKIKLTFDYVVRSLLFIPAISPGSGDIWPIIVQGWTLNFEMFFYGLFAVSLLFSPAVRLGLLSIALLGLVTIGLFYSPQDPLWVTFTRPLLLEFLIGVFVGELWTRGKLRDPAIGMCCVVTGLGIFAFVYWTGRPIIFQVTAVPATLLVVGVFMVEGAGRMPCLPMASYLGDASFSIYLWHSLAIAVTSRLATVANANPTVSIGLHFLGGILVGLLAYELVEKRLNLIFRRRRKVSSSHA